MNYCNKLCMRGEVMRYAKNSVEFYVWRINDSNFHWIRSPIQFGQTLKAWDGGRIIGGIIFLTKTLFSPRFLLIGSDLSKRCFLKWLFASEPAAAVSAGPPVPSGVCGSNRKAQWSTSPAENVALFCPAAGPCCRDSYVCSLEHFKMYLFATSIDYFLHFHNDILPFQSDLEWLGGQSWSCSEPAHSWERVLSPAQNTLPCPRACKPSPTCQVGQPERQHQIFMHGAWTLINGDRDVFLVFGKVLWKKLFLF